MTIEIKVPGLPESVSDATIAKIYKAEGDAVERDDNLLDLETDKVMIEVPAASSGTIEKLAVKEGDVVVADQLLMVLKEGAAKVAAKSEAPLNVADEQTADQSKGDSLSPAVRRLIQENNLDASQMTGSGKGGRITKLDVEQFIKSGSSSVSTASSTEATTITAPQAAGARMQERVPMSRLRARIAERLVQAQQDAALLTTFNEIDMKPVMDLRKQYKDKFEKVHETRLGFMSFFVKACVEALRRFPDVNASIDGSDVVYHNFQDIGIAVGSDRGLVVPILRNAEHMSMADIEKQVRGFGKRAAAGKISLDEMTGGTFTITNGGTFGSMMSTPIINPPQSAILGMHNIVERAVVVNGEIVVRPIMYVALSYDHRIIDGSTSVRFLYTIKELIEDPARLLLEV